MQNVYVGESHNGIPIAKLSLCTVEDFSDFCDIFIKYYVKIAPKNNHYIVIGDKYKITPGDPTASINSYKRYDHYHRNNESQITAWLLPLDADCSVSDPESSIDPEIAHRILVDYDLTHVIHTTYSHIPGKRHRWRALLPCKLQSPHQLQASVTLLYSMIKQKDQNMQLSNEASTWTQPWFLPTTDNLSKFRYFFHRGADFDPPASIQIQSSIPDPSIIPAEKKIIEIEKSRMDIATMIKIIQAGGHPLHETIRNYIWGALKDGRPTAWIKAELKAYAINWDLTDIRLKARLDDIDRMVNITCAKINTTSAGEETIDLQDDDNRVFTRYPDQGGEFEKMVQVCMQWMRFPNRQIAVTAIHALISVLGGRVYTFENGSGIVYTALITGRSTIGKSNVKKFIVHVLNSFSQRKAASEFVGSHYYTSSANMVKELSRYGTILSVRTESGQTDQSQAGDMKRVMLYELELAVEHGQTGYVSSAGQNEKIPDLFSPAVTTVRESVAEIQSQADLYNQSAISGISGRRSHIVVDPVKSDYNENRLIDLPKWFINKISQLYKYATETNRHDLKNPMPHNVWKYLKIIDHEYFNSRQAAWIKEENEEARKGNHFAASFAGRLYERVKSYAGRLAIADNPENPTITNEHLKIAETSLRAELLSKEENDAKSLSPWDDIVNEIKKLFKGDMSKNLKLKNCNPIVLLSVGACDWITVRKIIEKRDSFRMLKDKSNFHSELKTRLEHEGIYQMSRKTVLTYNKRDKKIFTKYQQ